MSGCVAVTGPPASFCALNFGTTEPLEASTLPKRTEMSRIGCWLRCDNSPSSAWQYISARRLVAPRTETGSIALSVEIITIAVAPAAAAASATFIEPNTLVLTASSQSRSSSGTCLSAAAGAAVGDTAGNFRRRSLGRKRLLHRVQRRLGILDHQQARGAEGDDALA